VLSDVSIGYELKGKPEINGDQYTWRNWSPYEVSVVSVGSDYQAGINRSYLKMETETKEAKEIRIAKEKETKAAQDKKDKEAADKLVADKKAKAEAYANRSFSERFKAGMKDPTTLNKLGMLMDYYGRNLQDRGENPLIAYEEAKADQMAASKPDSSTFNAVDMSDTVLTDLFTPSKGWMFFGKNEQERKTAAADMIGRYRTIQNAPFTRHGVILTHGEIMALLEDERDKAAAAQKAAANK